MEDQDKAGGRPVTESRESYSPVAETRLSKSGWTAGGQELLIRIFALLNQQITGLDTIREILAMVKEFTGCEAVGIRLREGQDFPYFETKGFPGFFVEAENSLCGRKGVAH